MTLEPCAICLKPFSNTQYYVAGHCTDNDIQHIFHSKCLDLAMRVQALCPLCRSPLEGQRKDLYNPNFSFTSCSIQLIKRNFPLLLNCIAALIGSGALVVTESGRTILYGFASGTTSAFLSVVVTGSLRYAIRQLTSRDIPYIPSIVGIAASADLAYSELTPSLLQTAGAVLGAGGFGGTMCSIYQQVKGDVFSLPNEIVNKILPGRVSALSGIGASLAVGALFVEHLNTEVINSSGVTTLGTFMALGGFLLAAFICYKIASAVLGISESPDLARD